MLICDWVINKNSLIVALSILCQFFISKPLWKLALVSWHFQGFRKEKLTWNGSIIKTNNECFLESYRSSRSQMFFKIGIPKNFAIFTVKHLCRSPILIKVCNDFKKRLQHKCFPVNIAKILRTSLFTEYIRWLLLNLHPLWFIKWMKIPIASWPILHCRFIDWFSQRSLITSTVVN